MKIKLFYSYSHKDAKYKAEIEKTLDLLKQKGFLDDWSDTAITPGTSISDAINKHIEDSNIYLFLLSLNFIASEPCRNEWERIKQLSAERAMYRIPIILEDCPWQDFLDGDDVKALPKDGKPISGYRKAGVSYKEIYEGIQQAIEDCRSCFKPKEKFLQEIKQSQFISQEHIDIEDIFIFPDLEEELTDSGDFLQLRKVEDLFSSNYALIHGDYYSGKTCLCKHLFLHLVEENFPVLFMDLEVIAGKKPNENIFKQEYNEQFHGDYNVWKKQDKKSTVIFDNLTSTKNSLGHIELAKSMFNRVIVVTSADQYTAFFKDEKRLAEFKLIKIMELSKVKVEKLIRKRLSMMKEVVISDEMVDQYEDRIYQVAHNNILPVYPFIVLSILQTLESYMPHNLEISSYGHCYRAILTSYLVKSGINQNDADLSSCFNFFEHYAFHLFGNNEKGSLESLTAFKQKYSSNFLIQDSVYNRATTGNYSIIRDGVFRHAYEYYYFLGAYLAKNKAKTGDAIQQIVKKNYLRENNLILMFLIHHTQDVELIEDMLLHNMMTFDGFAEAKLDMNETKFILDFIQLLPSQMLSNKPVSEERRKERERSDIAEKNVSDADNYDRDNGVEMINDIYRILKSNEIFGQILRNHHGNLPVGTIKDIVTTAISSGLRLIKIFLFEEQELKDLVEYIQARNPKADKEKLKRLCNFFCFLWSLSIIDRIVHAISVKEIHPLIKEVIDGDSTPARELVQYFSTLNVTEKFSEKEKQEFLELCKNHEDNLFIQRVASLRTQHYFNTHGVKHDIKQSVISHMGISYKPKRHGGKPNK